MQGFESARNHFHGRTVLNEESLAPALEMVKKSLLEADVEFGVVETFLENVLAKASGKKVKLRSKKDPTRKNLTPENHFTAICFEELKKIFGNTPYELKMDPPLSSIMLVGLQGTGKTTTAGKLAKRLLSQRPLLVACDIYRPAAVEQLMVIADAIGVPYFFKEGASPLEICQEAQKIALQQGCQVMIIDTAGRLSIDEKLMTEISTIKDHITPKHTLLVVDAMMGQDAVQTAQNFKQSVDFDAIVMTKMDGDARGGAALSIRYVTQKPIAFLGQGESYNDLDKFHPDGFSSRILGLGDMVSLMDDIKALEKEQEMINMMPDRITFDFFLKQMKLLKKLGPIRHIVSKLPRALTASMPNVNNRDINQLISILNSMTKREQQCLDVLNPSRMKRIAKGSGIAFPQVQNFLQKMGEMINKFHAMGNQKWAKMGKNLGMDPEQLAMLQQMNTSAESNDASGGSNVADATPNSGKILKEKQLENQKRRQKRKKEKEKRKSSKKSRKK